MLQECMATNIKIFCLVLTVILSVLILSLLFGCKTIEIRDVQNIGVQQNMEIDLDTKGDDIADEKKKTSN